MSEKQPDGTTPSDGTEPQDQPTVPEQSPAQAALPPIVAPEERATLSMPAVSAPQDAAPATSALAQAPTASPAPEAGQPSATATAAPAAAHNTLPPEESTVSPTAAPRKRRGGKIAALTIGGVVVLAGAAYVGGALFTQNKLPAHLTVDGIDLSGQSAQQASTTLREQLGSRASKAIQLKAGEQSIAIKPNTAGLGVDVDATLSKLTGLSWDPSVILSRLVGSQETSVVTTVDSSALSAAVKSASTKLDSAPSEGHIVITDGTAKYTEPAAGATVDQAKTATALENRWLHADGSIDAVTTVAEPAVAADAWKSFLDSTVTPLLDGPVSVTAAPNTAQLTAAQLGAASTITTDGGKPALSLNGEALVKDLVATNPKMASKGKDATVKLVGSADSASIAVVPAAEGKGIDAKELATAVQASTADAKRAATVTLKVTEPTITTKQGQAWKMTKVAEFATPYPTYDTQRTKNLRLGASRVNGTVVQPGQEFNLAKQFGPITSANGYVASGVVENGNATTALGGGISQISTMSYNAGFLGGMDILEHKPHSRWFDRYPAGRESTFWEGQVNMRWRNNTDAPVVVEMWVTGSQVKTVLWGQKTWDVKTKTSDHYNITSPGTVHSSAAKCTPEGGGRGGFTVTVTRERTSTAKSLPKESFVWTYAPWNRIVCDNK